MTENQKIESLEMKVAFLEDTLDKLSDEFYSQQKQMNILQHQQINLIQRLKDLSESNGKDELYVDEKPPHY